MIFMTVSNDKSLDLIHMIKQISNIRNNQIDSQHIIRGETQSTIHDNNTVFILKGSNIHSDLFQTTQWDHFQFGYVIIQFFLFQIAS